MKNDLIVHWDLHLINPFIFLAGQSLIKYQGLFGNLAGGDLPKKVRGIKKKKIGGL